jgi:hypothetical protein
MRIRIAAICVTALVACATMTPDAQAQSAAPGTAERAQQQYELDIAVCNTAGFPAPRREACIREAGQRLDNARIAPQAGAAVSNQDGRATVVAEPGRQSAMRASTLRTTTDGRATVVEPTR